MKPKYKWALGAREKAFMNHMKHPKLHFSLLFAAIQDMKLKVYAFVFRVTER